MQSQSMCSASKALLSYISMPINKAYDQQKKSRDLPLPYPGFTYASPAPDPVPAPGFTHPHKPLH